MKKVIFLLLLCQVLPLSAAEHKPHGESVELPDDISLLLKQEMQQIRQGMESLSWLVASGDFSEVAKVAHGLKEGYVMKRELTKEQRQILVSTLPKDFKALDQHFHKQAGQLAAAAQNHDAELVNFHIYKMNEACVACHSRFVSNRFEGFVKPNRSHHH